MLLGLKIAATGLVLLCVAKPQMGDGKEATTFEAIAIVVAFLSFWAIVVGLLMAIWGM